MKPTAGAADKLQAEAAKNFDVEEAAQQSRRRAVHFGEAEDIMRDRNWISFNLDGIWGGNMYAGGAGAILPNKITSKHNIRYVPEHERAGPVEKMKKQLIKNGYPDVDVKIIGDVPWRVGKLAGRTAASAVARARHHADSAQQAEGKRDADRRLLAGVLFGADYADQHPDLERRRRLWRQRARR